jgi:hypothetical protein
VPVIGQGFAMVFSKDVVHFANIDGAHQKSGSAPFGSSQ